MGIDSENFRQEIENNRYNGKDILLESLKTYIKRDLLDMPLDPSGVIPSLRTIYTRLQAIESENVNLRADNLKLKQEIADIAGLDIIKTVGKLAQDNNNNNNDTATRSN